MSQHDYVIDNAGGAAVRADINNALQAIKTLNSGATAPTVTAPFMFWFDTSAVQLKQRNSLDTAWNVVPIATSVGSSLVTAATQLAARAALGGNSFSVTASSASSLTSGSAGQIFFDTKEFDTANYYNTGTFRYVPQVAGKYLFSASIGWNNTTGGSVSTQLRKNGSTVKQASQNMAATITCTTTVTAVLDMNGSTDYVEVWGLQGTGTTFAWQNATNLTYFSGSMLL